MMILKNINMKFYSVFIIAFFACSSIFSQNNKANFDFSKIKFIYEDSVVFLNYKNQKDSLVFPIMPSASKEMQTSLRLENIIGLSVDSIVSEYEKCGCGYTSFEYLMNFNNESVISFIFLMDFSGSYNEENVLYRNYEIQTGKQRKLSDELTEAGLSYVLSQYKSILNSRLAKELNSNNNQDKMHILSTLGERISNLKIDDLSQNYLLSDKSLTIDLDDEIPHYARAFGIDMEVSFSVLQIRKYKSKESKILN
jgi:hypothetical protein